MIVCGKLGCFFTLRRLERQISRRGSGVRNWGRRGGEGKGEGGGGNWRRRGGEAGNEV